MDQARINRYYDKLTILDSNLNHLATWLLGHPFSTLDEETDLHWIYAILHVFQNIAENLTDIAAMIVKDKQIPIKDNYSNFRILFQNGIISNSSYDQLRRINGLRNRIAHEYNGLMYQIAWAAMNEFIETIQIIREEFSTWITKNS